ncbi:unnamed protein product, partial [Phaeothamnion confervicola]
SRPTLPPCVGTCADDEAEVDPVADGPSSCNCGGAAAAAAAATAAAAGDDAAAVRILAAAAVRYDEFALLKRPAADAYIGWGGGRGAIGTAFDVKKEIGWQLSCSGTSDGAGGAAGGSGGVSTRAARQNDFAASDANTGGFCHCRTASAVRTGSRLSHKEVAAAAPVAVAAAAAAAPGVAGTGCAVAGGGGDTADGTLPPGFVRPRCFNRVTLVDEKYVHKSGAREHMTGEIFFYRNIPAPVRDIFPAVAEIRDSADVPTPSIVLERVDGVSFSHLLVSHCLTPGRLRALLAALRRLHTCLPPPRLPSLVAATAPPLAEATAARLWLNGTVSSATRAACHAVTHGEATSGQETADAAACEAVTTKAGAINAAAPKFGSDAPWAFTAAPSATAAAQAAPEKLDLYANLAPKLRLRLEAHRSLYMGLALPLREGQALPSSPKTTLAAPEPEQVAIAEPTTLEMVTRRAAPWEAAAAPPLAATATSAATPPLAAAMATSAATPPLAAATATSAATPPLAAAASPAAMGAALLPFLEHYAYDGRAHAAGLIHGDPVFSNCLNTKEARVVLLDMRGTLGPQPTTAGDATYDLAKVYQSLRGYDFVILDRAAEARGEPGREALTELQEEFWSWVSAHYPTVRPCDIRVITASLFLSAVPLHTDRRHQLAFLATCEAIMREEGLLVPPVKPHP